MDAPRPPLRARAICAAVACALHLALFAPAVGERSGVLENDFGPEGEGIAAGDRPYRDHELEYPPLSVPVLVAPALVADSVAGYTEAFQWEMIGFDLAIVVLLALAVPGGWRRIGGALAVYTAGVVAISGIVLGHSDIESSPLALARFDLVPAFFVLAAVLAREAGRSALWSSLLSVGVAVKAFPAALFPALLRDERDPGRVAAAALAVLAVAAAIVLAYGDGFGSAISYHTERGLQIEAVAATPLEIAGIDDTSVAAEFGSGSFNFTGAGADEARAASLALMIALYAAVLWAGWRARTPQMRLATALLAVVTVLAPVLSPQFLFWLLPLSAAAYGLGPANVVLVAAAVMTQLMLQYYARVVVDFDPEFVWRLAGRNALLVVYLALVCGPILRDGLRARAEAPAERTAAA
ncbi:MAG: glycosyltransferase 87 family protein [Solirubrobacterales bacterium]